MKTENYHKFIYGNIVPMKSASECYASANERTYRTCKNRTPVETIILPSPTSGDTTPPKANPNAPSKAYAIPAFARSLSIAKVLEAVKVSPNIESNAKSSTS